MFDKIEEAIEAIRSGGMIIVVDDENRENEGDLLMAAEFADKASINFMARHGRGLICVPMVQADLEPLKIGQMVGHNTDPKGTAFTVSVDIKTANTGISAGERADTIQALLDPKSRPDDFTRPGHIFPLLAKAGGVLQRPGHTEAAIDFSRLAGLKAAGVICEIMNEDGSMARVDDLLAFKAVHKLKMVTIADLIHYRQRHEILVERVSQAKLPTLYGDFEMIGYKDPLTDKDHVALVKGDLHGGTPLVRIHSECLTGDAFGSSRCDCGQQLKAAMAMIQTAGSGVLIYMRQEGRGIGLLNKIKAYKLQDQGYDTVDANIALGFDEDLRGYELCGSILKDLRLKSVELMTNNPLKIKGLEDVGIKVLKRHGLEMKPCQENQHYLNTKKVRMGHLLSQEV